MKKASLLIIFLLLLSRSFSQFIPEHLSNEAVYAFVDELATIGLLDVNSAVKPYSRYAIGKMLEEADRKKERLNKRQLQMLAFYLKSYSLDRSAFPGPDMPGRTNLFRKQQHIATSLNPFGFHYKDSLLTLSIRPVYGISYRKNENGSVNSTSGGGEAYATMGKHWGAYASLRDMHESELLADTGFFTLQTGGAFKKNNGGRSGGDYSEMRGGITYAWKWGDVGLIKDNCSWGNNYHGSNILSGRTPSFTQLRLHAKPAKWIELNYIHGWLVSEVIDSARSYFNGPDYKRVYKQKFIAANFITLIPLRNLYISAGNSIIYSDLGGVHPAYLIPVAFYKSIDHTLNHGIENQNSQMFLDISSRQIKHLHLFVSVFVDEFSVTRLKDREAHNFISWKGGWNLVNFPLRNVSLKAEFTQTTPITYKHDIPAITFESNGYSLGHYLLDNSREVYLELALDPIARLHASLSYTLAEHGNEYSYIRSNYIANMPMLSDIIWSARILDFKLNYQFLNNAWIYATYSISDIRGTDADGLTADDYLDRYTPAFYRGETQTSTFGFRFGF